MGLFRAPSLEELRSAPLTYPEVGASRWPELPAGYHHGEHSADVGSGAETFHRCVAAVFDWRAQRAAGLRVRASGPPSEPGTVVVLTAGLTRFGYDIPCRVVWTQTDGDEQGFGYGTLPGHPESGEECFLVRLGADGAVTFRTRVFSRLASPAPRLGGPLSRAVQHAALQRYVTAIRGAGRQR